jgi:STE24 endopeptidase
MRVPAPAACRVAILLVALLSAVPTRVGACSGPEPGRVADAAPPAAPSMVANPLGAVPADEPRAVSYAHGGYLLFAAGVLWSILLLCAFVSLGVGVKLERLAAKVTASPNGQAAIVAALLTVAFFAGTFPLRFYRGFLREAHYGFASQTLRSWLGDEGKALLVETILQAILITLLFLALRRLGRRFWIVGSAIVVLYLVVVLAAGPVFIAPLFNTFEPLRDADLRGEILELARTHGIPADEVYEMDASRQSTHNNAYVAGLLGTERIVLFDTMLRHFSRREIRFIMAHEMGHYLLNHVWKYVAFASIFITAGLWLVDRVTRRLIARHPGLGVASVAQPAVLPLALLILNLTALPALPALTGFSRYQEHEADRLGLEITRDPEAAASVFIKFGRYDLGEYEVNPWIEAILFSHPSLGGRIRYAQEFARSLEVTSPQ